jgi:hypothetical protein
MSELRTWADAERTLANLPRPAVATFASRAARRSTSAVAKLEAKYGPEAHEWLNAIDAVLGVVERFAAGASVSRFTLDLAADAARCTANATANAARTLGPSPLMEEAELAYAAAAFAADAARAATDARAASVAMQAARAAAGGGAVPAEQAADLRALANGEVLEALPSQRVERAELFRLFVAPAS